MVELTTDFKKIDHKVLSELQWRLDVIAKMEELIEDPETRELQELQPLFERGLWIFGPEYESIEYQSNKTLSTIIRELFKGKGTEVSTPKRRPDFVILPDSSISVYTADAYEDGDVSGIRKILIVELKRSGYKIGVDEKRQASDYAIELKDSGKIPPTAQIVCFVIGANVDKKAEGETTEAGGQIVIKPITYELVLRKAHARTFNLMKRIKEAKNIRDSELVENSVK